MHWGFSARLGLDTFGRANGGLCNGGVLAQCLVFPILLVYSVVCVFFLAAVHVGMLCLKVNGGNVMERGRWGESKSPLISVE